jgi:hypothetical protein
VPKSSDRILGGAQLAVLVGPVLTSVCRPVRCHVLSPKSRDFHSHTAFRIARHVLERRQEHSSTRLLTRVFSVTDLSCHRALISSRFHTLSNPTKVVDETVCDEMKNTLHRVRGLRSWLRAVYACAPNFRTLKTLWLAKVTVVRVSGTGLMFSPHALRSRNIQANNFAPAYRNACSGSQFPQDDSLFPCISDLSNVFSEVQIVDRLRPKTTG